MTNELLEQIMRHIRNRFEVGAVPVRSCKIENGELPANAAGKIAQGQYYWISGSVFNDGLHVHPDNQLHDETFDGMLTLSAVPKAFLDLADEIADWIDANAEAERKALESPYGSESFGGYSYSLRDGLVNSGGDGLSGWQASFASRLNVWRKI